VRLNINITNKLPVRTALFHNGFCIAANLRWEQDWTTVSCLVYTNLV